MIEKKERMVEVNDDWYPCFPGNKVRLRLSLSLLYFKLYYIKLSAWGADDTGVEIECHASDFQDAADKYNTLSKVYDSVPDGCDRQWFFDHGFVRA